MPASQQLLECYLPDAAPTVLRPEVERLAGEFENHHRWAEGTIKSFAEEPNTFEVDEEGNPTTQTITYETLYWSMSSFVHVNIGALLVSHLPETGDVFRLRTDRPVGERDRVGIETAARSLGLVVDRTFTFFGIAIPDELSQRFQRLLTDKKPAARRGLVES